MSAKDWAKWQWAFSISDTFSLFT